MVTSVWTVLAFAGLAVGFARVLNAPKSAIIGILLGVVLLLLAAVLFLPEGTPLRESVSGNLNGLGLLAIIAIPVGLYALGLQQLKRRTGLTQTPATLTGFVLIEDDAALQADILAKLEEENRAQTAWGVERFSVAHRGDDGEVEASGSVSINMELAEIARVWVTPDKRGTGLGLKLMGQLESEARRRGARAVSLYTYSWQAEAFYLRLGYSRYGVLTYPIGTERILMRKDLV
jgi:N-acetylglutamate synthase-like GNAT family acetyltransferase